MMRSGSSNSRLTRAAHSLGSSRITEGGARPMSEFAPDAQMRALKAWAIERMIDGTGTPWAWF